jgi:hypothetical protein
MEIVIPSKTKKLKQIGVRLTVKEYELISLIAKEKKASRSFVAETLIRAAMGELEKVEK